MCGNKVEEREPGNQATRSSERSESQVTVSQAFSSWIRVNVYSELPWEAAQTLLCYCLSRCLIRSSGYTGKNDPRQVGLAG
jgi:hypothetical protein